MNQDNFKVKGNEFGTLECPSLMEASLNDYCSQTYTTALLPSLEVSVSSNVSAITEEGLSFPSQCNDGDDLTKSMKRLHDHHRKYVDVFEDLQRAFLKEREETLKEVEYLKTENLSLKTKIEDSESPEILRLEMEVSQLRTKFEDLEKKYDKVVAENGSLKSDNEKLNELFENSESREIPRLKMEVSQLRTKFEDLEKKYDKVVAENGSLKSDNEKLNELFERSDLDKVKVELRKSNVVNARLRKDISATVSLMDEVLEKNTCLSNECKHLRASIQNFNDFPERVQSIQEITIRSETILAQNQTLRCEIDVKKSNIHSMKESLRTYKGKEIESTRKIEGESESRVDIDEKQEICDKLEEEHRELTAKLQQLKQLEDGLKCEIGSLNSIINIPVPED